MEAECCTSARFQSDAHQACVISLCLVPNPASENWKTDIFNANAHHIFVSCVHFLRWLVGILWSVAGIFLIDQASPHCAQIQICDFYVRRAGMGSLLFFTCRITVGSGQQTFLFKSVVVRRVP